MSKNGKIVDTANILAKITIVNGFKSLIRENLVCKFKFDANAKYWPLAKNPLIFLKIDFS